jgi:serpin B
MLLNTVLTAMGMEQSFGGNSDFSDLFVEDLDLSISRVIHQSFLEVDEEGTEAAAATVVEIRELSAGPNEKPSVIQIDQPFAFFIREKHSSTILFSGKLIDPSM